MSLALTLALRDLRGALRGMGVFLLCLALGVAAVTAVGTLRDALTRTIETQGRVLLGGDAQMSFTYRFAAPEERAFMEGAGPVSEIVTFRSSAERGEARVLTEVKAVDAAYPLSGAVTLDPPIPLAQALQGPGAAIDPLLAARLGLKVGDSFQLAGVTLRLGALLMQEPDAATGGFGLAPRTLVPVEPFRATGLFAPGTLFETHLRVVTERPLAELAKQAKPLENKGMRWADARNAAPGAERFVTRLSAFLVLVGLAGMAVAGLGVSTATRAWIEARSASFATLRTLGAEGRTIRAMVALEIGMLAGLGILLGLALGTLGPMLAGPLLAQGLPVQVTVGPSLRALAEATVYGALATAIFTLLPAARVTSLSPARLFRDLGDERRARVSLGQGMLLAALVALLVLAAGLFTTRWALTLGTLLAVASALGLLALAGIALKRLARHARPLAQGRPALRLALAALTGPRADTVPVTLALGLGLATLATIGQIESNLRAALARDLPAHAPAFFLLDLPRDATAPLMEALREVPGVSRTEAAPMLRGVITKINDRPAREVAGAHWVLRGDRGVTTSETLPEGTTITSGRFWESDATEPQISFSAEEGAEMGLKLGDRLTVNILGRDITAPITSFRKVDFSGAGMGFIMAMNPAALKGAPFSQIATVYASPEAELPVLRLVDAQAPGATAVRVADVIGRARGVLETIGRAITVAASATLLTGLAVLMGVAAAGQAARAREAAMLKALGASRSTLRASFALRAALTGLAAGLVAVGFALAAGWVVTRWLMEVPFAPALGSALGIVALGAGASLLAGLLFSRRALRASPSEVLRDRG